MYRSTRYSQDNSNEAPLKMLTTAKRLSQQQHAALTQEKIQRRRDLEVAKEFKKMTQDFPW